MVDLFCFTEKEKANMGPECREVLIPNWYDPVTSPCVHTVPAFGIDL